MITGTGRKIVLVLAVTGSYSYGVAGYKSNGTARWYAGDNSVAAAKSNPSEPLNLLG